MTHLLNLVWLGFIAATVAVWFLPVPFQGTLLFFCGLVNGRMAARYL